MHARYPTLSMSSLKWMYIYSYSNAVERRDRRKQLRSSKRIDQRRVGVGVLVVWSSSRALRSQLHPRSPRPCLLVSSTESCKLRPTENFHAVMGVIVLSLLHCEIHRMMREALPETLKTPPWASRNGASDRSMMMVSLMPQNGRP